MLLCIPSCYGQAETYAGYPQPLCLQTEDWFISSHVSCSTCLDNPHVHAAAVMQRGGLEKSPPEDYPRSRVTPGVCHMPSTRSGWGSVQKLTFETIFLG